MNVTVNNKIEVLPDMETTLAELLAQKGIGRGGVAVALNDRIVRHSKWEETILKEGDSIVIISAAFGG